MFRMIYNINIKYTQRYFTKSVRENRFFKAAKYLPELILSHKINSIQECQALREKILQASTQFTTKNIDSTIINICIAEKLYEEAKSYINYLKVENIKLSLAVLGKCFRLHHTLYSEGLSTKEDEENILLMYEDLLKEYPLLDAMTNEHIILGLSATKDWKKCFKHLNDIKISSLPNGAAYNAIINAAFCHEDYVTGWQVFQEMIENNRLPQPSTYLSYLDKIEKSEYKSKCLKFDDLLEYVACNDLKFDIKVADKILKMNKGRSRITTVSKDGTCQTCKKKLSQFDLSASEFEQLKKLFFEKIIIGTDVFCNTSPAELEKFKNFVDNMKKYDVIIDGLNVIYSAGVRQPPLVTSELLVSVVRHFIEQGKKVLVMGRTHLARLPKQNWNFVTRNAAVFLTENISQDDPYMLYCALHCGRDTIIVTRDLMRSHLFLLKDRQYKLLFHRWLTKSRYHLLHVTPDKVFFKKPLPYMVVPQKDENQRHIPYAIDSGFTNDVTYKWLCIDT